MCYILKNAKHGMTQHLFVVKAILVLGLVVGVGGSRGGEA